jgi:hypothetical protein
MTGAGMAKTVLTFVIVLAVAALLYWLLISIPSLIG